MKSNEGMSLIYQDEKCAKCNVHIRYGEVPGSSQRTQLYVVDGNGKYKESKCHPYFRKKQAGHFLKGLSNSANSDECGVCKRKRGSPGCRTVDGDTLTDHLSPT